MEMVGRLCLNLTNSESGLIRQPAQVLNKNKSNSVKKINMCLSVLLLGFMKYILPAERTFTARDATLGHMAYAERQARNI